MTKYCPPLSVWKTNFVLSIVVFCGLLVFSPSSAKAYDNDTHFWLTYYLAIKAGYTHIQATQIASADVTLDLDSQTNPVLPSLENPLQLFRPLEHQQEVRARLHALPSKAQIVRIAKPDPAYWWSPLVETDPATLKIMRELVTTRKKEYWKETLTPARNPGLFLHYLQDTFAHDGYKSLLGHAGYYRVDFLATDRKKAEAMAMATLKYLVAFREVYFAQKSAAQFSDPETIDLAKFFTEAQLVEIIAVVRVFCEANSSTGISESSVIKAWNETSENDRVERDRLPPYRYASAFREAKALGACPDSAKARVQIMRLMLLKENDLPLIWRYDLRADGTPTSKPTETVFAYVTRKNAEVKKVFNGDDEADNLKKTNSFDSKGKKECLPFNLMPSTQTALPLCGK